VDQSRLPFEVSTAWTQPSWVAMKAREPAGSGTTGARYWATAPRLIGFQGAGQVPPRGPRSIACTYVSLESPITASTPTVGGAIMLMPVKSFHFTLPAASKGRARPVTPGSEKLPE
jgi:hypothetical protein